MPIRFLLSFLVLGLATTAAYGQQQPLNLSPTIRQTSGSNARQPHALDAAIRYTDQAMQRAMQVPGYTARMIRVSTASGKRSTMTIDVKLRTEPFSVYLSFVSPNAGREVMYIDGWNQNRLIAHEGSGPLSIVGTISLDPMSPRALKNGGRPITQTGIIHLAKGVGDEWREAIQRGIRDDEVSVNHYPEAMLGDIETEAVEVRLARPVTSTGQTTLRIFLDRKSKLPIAMQAYGPSRTPGQPGPMLEEVRYVNLDASRVPTAQDFDPRNPSYRF